MPIPAIDDADIDTLLEEVNATSVNEALSLDEARRAAIREHRHVHACPGAGKTTLIGLKLVLLARKWRYRHCGLCVLTHTNVAKDEILKRVRTDAAATSLISYPHFIGTIQDFVQTFLALPACRSKGYPIRHIDDSTTAAYMRRRLAPSTRTYLDNKNASTSRLRLEWAQDQLSVNVPGAPGTLTASYQNMIVVKNQTLENGYFFFSEMYAFARELISTNPSVIDALRQRFPLVLIDETQDTLRFQDELINHLFGDAAGCTLQKVGDPDQAIFDGMSGEPPNETFNAAIDLAPIPDSGRFTANIADKFCGLSTRRIALTGSRPTAANSPSCTFILYSNDTIGSVLDQFGAIVAGLPEADRKVVKAIGGRAEGEALSIQSYWQAFDRNQANKIGNADKFCECVRSAVELKEGPVHTHYQHLRQGLVELLRLGGKTAIGRSGAAVPITLANVRRYFDVSGKMPHINALMADLMLRSVLTADEWAGITQRLCDIFDVDSGNAAIAEYLAYADHAPELLDEVVLPGNVYLSPGGHPHRGFHYPRRQRGNPRRYPRPRNQVRDSL
ncbi:UvrD-helicase domain-containing protein [uncultured Sphingosinicella sp.]|uniref:UvrD-helicase domain-containing protein n=1 Tax=uncultured Sphingosinicella sp. TaxID=478748 RepID=UPI0030DBDD8D|tara:strand:- start:27755 stop:29434 length:1680 start_codon:yes stop_codon:yes gene_type:complete